ncbi:hypothetical protein [Chondromyces crocatus]|uniref:Outer membrane protein beta-barrel domain-containing protein n=1 Tax=Chondromyces crocatus TaxID=52 RepID=A0A0K1EU49_CHOCO|nr:hypothetical protein [Chondromyces crocatus]AKT44148.1 uncharacterized protein CMC5_083880 [Chondromyces crocatus]
MRTALLFFACLLGLTGCAPALSTFQPAHVARKGHVQIQAGTDVSLPTGGVASLVNAAETLATIAERRELGDAEKQTLFDAGATLAVNAPSPVPHIGIAYTVLDGFEISARYSGALRLGLRYQFLEKARHGLDMSVGLGGARYTLAFPVGNVLDILELEDFQRWQFDIPLLLGTSGSWYRLWGGPKAMFTTFGTKLVLTVPETSGSSTAQRSELASFDGTAFYVGGQAGAAIGYKYVFVGFELSMAYLAASTQMQLLGQRAYGVNLDSLVVAPGIALMTEF